MEMVSAKAIYYNNKNTELLMEIHPEEKAGFSAAVWIGSGYYQRNGKKDRGKAV